MIGKFSDLKAADSTLQLIWGDETTLSFQGLSHIWDPKEHTCLFMKARRYLQQLGRFSTHKNYKTCGLIIEETFFQSLKTEEKEELKKSFSFGVQVKNVNIPMTSLSQVFYDEKFSGLNSQLDGRINGTAEIHPSAKIAQNVFIGCHTMIGENVEVMPGTVILSYVKIAAGTKLYPNCTIYPFSSIGKNCRIHGGVVIGADGFGYHFHSGSHRKIWHFSGVEIGDDVEIGATSTVDAGAFISTKIGDGTRIDNGVQVGHNAQVGKHVVLCGQVAVSGSVILEDYCVLGGMSGVGPGAILGKGTQVAAAAIVSENADWPQGSILGGKPAMPLKEYMKHEAQLRILTKQGVKK